LSVSGEIRYSSTAERYVKEVLQGPMLDFVWEEEEEGLKEEKS